eukprot:symbB.v1.2.036872.t1/scaffold5310.1/size28534/4
MEKPTFSAHLRDVDLREFVGFWWKSTCNFNRLIISYRGPGGLLEVINTICTPTTPQAQEMRLKWQKKEYGKDALFDSLFPDLKQFKDDYDNQDHWWDIWLMLGFLLLLIGGLAAMFFYGMPISSSKTATTTTTTVLTSSTSPSAEL